MWIDYVNASFEFISGFMVLLHCKNVIRDKAVAGVSIPATAFFALWGMWNVFYYPQLDQFFSAIAGVFICFANCLWVYLLLKYK